MKYKIQMFRYKYNPETGRCSDTGRWGDWPEEFSTRQEAEKEMSILIRDDGHFPDEIRIVELSLPIK